MQSNVVVMHLKINRIYRSIYESHVINNLLQRMASHHGFDFSFQILIRLIDKQQQRSFVIQKPMHMEKCGSKFMDNKIDSETLSRIWVARCTYADGRVFWNGHWDLILGMCRMKWQLDIGDYFPKWKWNNRTRWKSHIPSSATQTKYTQTVSYN